jgi:small-conductance mechanosensitive channel
LLSLSIVGIDITALSVFSGALAVGLGLGLQKIASNYVSGFIILLDRSIRIGNLVALDATTSGVVTQITARYTVLRTLAGTEVIIPNEYLVSNIVRNESSPIHDCGWWCRCRWPTAPISNRRCA